MAGGGSQQEKEDNLNFCVPIHIMYRHFTLEVTGAQSWYYYIGPKMGKGQVCLTRQYLHPFPSRWRGLESPLLEKN